MIEPEKIWDMMKSGERYDALHPHLVELLADTRDRIYRYNSLPPSQTADMREILHALLGDHGENFQFNQPFRCDYGCNIHIGENFFANFNFTVLDEAEVRIGDNCFIGPNVSIFTACHPLDAESRNKGIEWAEPVTVGNSVWIGGDCTILPGVTIGNNVVVGGGSVVSRDIPDNSVAVGNPARVIKRLPG